MDELTPHDRQVVDEYRAALRAKHLAKQMPREPLDEKDAEIEALQGQVSRLSALHPMTIQRRLHAMKWAKSTGEQNSMANELAADLQSFKLTVIWNTDEREYCIVDKLSRKSMKPTPTLSRGAATLKKTMNSSSGAMTRLSSTP